MTNQKQFSGSWGIILGGSSGFGFATLQKLARLGMNVAILYRETAAADNALKENLSRIASANGITILPYNMNALDREGRRSFLLEFTAIVEHQPVVRLLLHSIARGNLKPLLPSEGKSALSMEDVELTSYAMAGSLLDWSRDLLHAGLFGTAGRIIGLTSEGAHKYWEGYGAVSIAKASLESLATYMAVEFAKHGLRTNVIQAGMTDTPALARIPGIATLMESAAQRNPLGRVTLPEDVANAVYLLCTDEASWINGALLHVDGGEHCR